MSHLEPVDQVALHRVNKTTRSWVEQAGDYELPAQRPPDLFLKPGYAPLESSDLNKLAHKAFENFQSYLQEIYRSTYAPPLIGGKVEGEKEAKAAKESSMEGKRAWAVVKLPDRALHSTNFLKSKYKANEHCMESISSSGQLISSTITGDDIAASESGRFMYHGQGEYDRREKEHAELRIGESRYARRLCQEKDGYPIAVNMAYCVFCAAQLAALGERLVHPYHTGGLQWYRFSEWILFFRSKREKLWGADVENVYRTLSVDRKKIFLRALLKKTGGSMKPEKVTWKSGSGSSSNSNSNF